MKLKIDIHSDMMNDIYRFYWLLYWSVDRPYIITNDRAKTRNV